MLFFPAWIAESRAPVWGKQAFVEEAPRGQLGLIEAGIPVGRRQLMRCDFAAARPHIAKGDEAHHAEIIRGRGAGLLRVTHAVLGDVHRRCCCNVPNAAANGATAASPGWAVDEVLHGREKGAHQAAHMRGQLAADQIERLDAVRALRRAS